MALLVVFVNVAFLGVIWHAGRMVLSAAAPDAPPRGETSAWMVVAMCGCLIVVVGLGLHLPGDLARLLGDAAQRLSAPTP